MDLVGAKIIDHSSPDEDPALKKGSVRLFELVGFKIKLRSNIW